MMEEIKYGPLTLEWDEGPFGPGYCVTACEKDVVEVEIPPQIGEYNVIAIGEYTFSGCTSLVSIHIPDTVSSISRGAFQDCCSLAAVTFSSDAYAGPYAFSGCRSLVSLPSLGSVSEGMLRDCKSLMNVTLTKYCHEIDEDAFEHCESLRQVVIPSSVDRIEALAFRGCYALTRVTFEEPKGWYMKNCYNGAEVALDLSDPADNAYSLSRMDFDDGVIAWYRKK